MTEEDKNGTGHREHNPERAASQPGELPLACDPEFSVAADSLPASSFEGNLPAEPDAGALRREEEAAARRQYVLKETKEWIKSIAIALVLALLIKTTLFQAYMIPTGSMEPTIVPRDRVFGNRFVYRLRDPKPGEIIAFKPPELASMDSNNPRGLSYLKRVMAVGGDTISVHNGVVYRNGIPLDEPYIMEPPGAEYEERRIPKDFIFVMGDNRNNSSDSRYWGLLPVKNIQAKAFFRFWPFQRIGVLR